MKTLQEAEATIQRLEALLKQKDEELNLRRNEIQHLLEWVEFLRRKHYAPKSEIVSSQQLGLFNEAEEISHIESDSDDEDSKETHVRGHTRKSPRKRISDDLPREEVIVDIPEEEKICPHDGSPLKKIGEDINEKIEYIPAQVKVVKTIRYKYACPCCQDGVKSSPLELSLFPKSMATASLLAAIIIAKFADHLPLYRQEKIYARIGFIVTRATMANWLIKIAEKLIPIYNLLQEKLLARDYIQIDETTVQVLNEEGKKATSRSYMWVRFSAGEDPIVLYDYSPTRSGSVPVELLQGFSGYLQCDGYDGYSKVTSSPVVIRVGCMDHCRRKFNDAFKSSKGKGIAKRAMIIIKKLYEIEDNIKNESHSRRLEIRKEKSQLLMNQLKLIVDENRSIVSPNSLTGKAINYAFNEWPYLERYLEDGKLEISNIWVENKIRPFALGRKNWLFSASVEGAKSSAIIYGILETAKSNDIPPFDYFQKTLDKLPSASTVEDFEQLLPLKSIQK